MGFGFSIIELMDMYTFIHATAMSWNALYSSEISLGALVSDFRSELSIKPPWCSLTLPRKRQGLSPVQVILLFTFLLLSYVSASHHLRSALCAPVTPQSKPPPPVPFPSRGPEPQSYQHRPGGGDRGQLPGVGTGSDARGGVGDLTEHGAPDGPRDDVRE